MSPLQQIFSMAWRMSEIHSRDSFLLPTLTELSFIVKEAQLLCNIIHDQVSIDLRLAANDLFVGLAKFTHLGNVESLIRVKLQHSHDHLSQLWTILLCDWRKLSLCDPLEQIIQRKIFFVVKSEGTPQHAKFVSYAS